MTDLIQLAKAKRTALAAEVAKLDAFIKTAEQLEMEAPPGLAHTGIARHNAMSQGLTVSQSFPIAVEERISKKEQVLRVCREIVGGQGPQPLGALYAALQSRGVDPGSKDPKGMLSIMLNRSEEFVSDKERGGWAFAKSNAPTGANR
jgi:hypothetical protein